MAVAGENLKGLSQLKKILWFYHFMIHLKVLESA